MNLMSLGRLAASTMESLERRAVDADVAPEDIKIYESAVVVRCSFGDAATTEWVISKAETAGEVHTAELLSEAACNALRTVNTR